MKHLALILVTLACIGCSPKPDANEQSIRIMCTELLQQYPQATLQDVYKSCYQDFFGAEHLIADTAMARRYLSDELAECAEQDLAAMPAYEPTGFRGRCVRINLSQVLNGNLSESELFRLFLLSAHAVNAYSNQWADEWQQIENIALAVQPLWADATLQEQLTYAAQHNAPVRHSAVFRQAYNPHYRIVSSELNPLLHNQ